MENLSVDIAAYLKATVFNWFFLGPGLVMVVLELLDKVGGWKVPGKTYIHLVFTACLVAAMFLTWRDVYQDNQRLSGELETVRKELDKPIVEDDGSQAIITDLRQQLNDRNFEIQELKRLKDNAVETARHSASDNAALNNKLRDLQEKFADKVTRQAHMEKLATFLDTGEAIKRKCFLGSDTPRKEAVEWHDQVLSYLKTTMDSAHVIRFKNTRSPDAKMHYFLPDGTPVAKQCNDNAQDMDTKLEVLRYFLSELST